MKQKLIEERGQYCEICGKPSMILEAHHCIFGRMKGKKELDHPMNLQLVCPSCHASVANSYENRQAFCEKQALRYGKEFYSWYESLSLKVRRF